MHARGAGLFACRKTRVARQQRAVRRRSLEIGPLSLLPSAFPCPTHSKCFHRTSTCQQMHVVTLVARLATIAATVLACRQCLKPCQRAYRKVRHGKGGRKGYRARNDATGQHLASPSAAMRVEWPTMAHFSCAAFFLQWFCMLTCAAMYTVVNTTWLLPNLTHAGLLC